MQIIIHASDFTLTDALKSHIERRMNYAFAACDETIQHIIVRLSDVNGPRGGRDKCCRIQVITDHLADVVIEDIEADMYNAIRRAADRASRTLMRKLRRRRRIDRYDAQTIHAINRNVAMS